MKISLLLALVLLLLQNAVVAQKSKSRNVHAKAVATDSAKLNTDFFIVDRDSAFSDPRIAIRKLHAGNKRFVGNKLIRPRQDTETIKRLGLGQKHFATIVGCSDSRVPNEMVFDQGVGAQFIIRTDGQVSSAASYGSIEYAVLKLYTSLIVILGHTECGAVAAAVERPQDVPGHIVTLSNEIKPAVAKSSHLPGDPVYNAIRQNVIDQVISLRDLDLILHKNIGQAIS